MTSNRVSQYLDPPTEHSGPAFVDPVKQSRGLGVPARAGHHGPLSASDVNRVAWEQAIQMVRARHQMRNWVARFF